MSVSTSILSNHKIITDPTNTHEVSKVLGRASLDVGALCSSGAYINRWARYKPVRYGLLDTITTQWNASGSWSSTTTKWKSTATWWKGAGLDCGITVESFDNPVAMCDAWLEKASSGYSWHDFWQYAPPRGSAASPNEPYRLTDFAGYCHFHMTKGEDWDKPLAGWHIGVDGMAAEIHRYQDGGNYYIGENSTINVRNDNAYLLSITDISMPLGAATVGFGDTYFGVAFVFNYTSLTQANRLYSFITCLSDFGTNVTPSDADQSSGKDIRITPNFPVSMFNQVPDGGKLLAFPFLSTQKITSSNSLATLSGGNPDTHTQYKYVPLPFYGKEVTFVHFSGNIKMVVEIVTVSTSAGSIYPTIKIIASRTTEQDFAGWDDDDIEIIFTVFQDGQSPPYEYRYNAPAMSGFTDNSQVGTKYYQHQYTITGAQSGKNELMVTLASYNGNIVAGSGATWKNLTT